VIRFDDVAFAYGEGAPVLAGATLDIPPGLTLLLGRNGCGKSTLLKLAAGVEKPDRGRVEVDGLDLWMEEAKARRSLAYVPEHPDLTPYATIGEIVTLVARLRGEPLDGVDRALDFAGVRALAGHSVRELSMGQRRRAVLACARVGTPRHVLLDEPLEAMDRLAREDVLAWIDDLVGCESVVLVVSHDIEPFAARAARAITVRAQRPVVLDPLPAILAERRSRLEEMARPASGLA
jgi:ABC-type multidrug transport system ATPase subunit